MKHILFCLAFIHLITFPSNGQSRTNALDQDEELGQVSWYRNYDLALKISEAQNKPLLILFQEVPGCATCRNYGHNVLSNPLMTEVIENEFVPLAIFNNKGGADAKILKKYNEPSWNNPVVRIVDTNGEDLVKRVASDYSAKGLYRAMESALTRFGNEPPIYMKLLGKELGLTRNTAIKETHYKMYCFWTGEKELGAQEGVVATKAGFMKGEVVKVTYNEDEISKATLDQFAKAHQMIPVQKGQFRWSESDEDYYLQHSRFKYVPLSEMQKTKINSALGKKEAVLQYLSPKQLQWFKKGPKEKILCDQEFSQAWAYLLKS